jgi:RNA polymerase sigma-70 factor, ECF subfamily
MSFLIASAPWPNRHKMSASANAQALKEQQLRGRLDQFLRGLEKRAYQMALMSLRNPDDAMDAVQECMTAFVKNYALKDEADWPKLFYTVLDSKLNDGHRRNTTRRRFFGLLPQQSSEDDIDVLDVIADGTSFDPSELHAAGQTGAGIVAAVEKLPLRQRQAFLLRMWEGFDVAQTADVMRCSEGSVKTHLSRALHNLRGQLQNFIDQPAAAAAGADAAREE